MSDAITVPQLIAGLASFLGTAAAAYAAKRAHAAATATEAPKGAGAADGNLRDLIVALGGELKGLRSDVADLRSDVGDVRHDLNGIASDVERLKRHERDEWTPPTRPAIPPPSGT